MSAPGLAQIWSLGIPSTDAAPQVPNYDIWVVNSILINRVITNIVASQLKAIPRSETRLRDEGFIPFYSFMRDRAETLKSSARERGVAFHAFPEAPADWNEDASTDFGPLAAQFRPHLVEPMRVAMDWNLGLRDRDSRPHWTSEAAASSVSIDLFIQVVLAMGGALGGSEWGPFVEKITSDELRGIAGVIGEELLRIRAQPGSGWDEEEAKGLTKEQLVNAMGIMAAGT